MRDGLALQATDGWPIPNGFGVEPASRLVALARGSILLAIASSRELNGPSGRYNCHGLTFASRRTGIPPAGEPERAAQIVLEILRRDRYAKVPDPQVGDVVVYRASRLDDLSQALDVDHTGIVCAVEELGHQVFVWSKWGELGEFRHRVDCSPYDGALVEYWRLVTP